MAPQAFRSWLDQGVDLRPSIAITRAHINMPELRDAIDAALTRVMT